MILTGLQAEGLKLSRKPHNFDRFADRRAKAVKKAP
jgi:hypothetical protein